MYERKDHFYKKAKKEGLASRAAYKILEIQKKFRICKGGDQLLELGCAPGGWLQILSQQVGPKGRVVGVDLLPLKIKLPLNAIFLQQDMEEENLLTFLNSECLSFDAIVSDISPNLSGITFRDTFRSYELALKVWKLAQQFLKKGGHLVLKIFPGDESNQLKKELRHAFMQLVTFIPEATRKSSSEVYLVAKGLKGR